MKKRHVLKPAAIKATHADWVREHSLALKYPLAHRIAAWLYRGGISGRVFQDHFHTDGFGLSRQVLEHMTNFDLGKGVEAERVPGFLPEIQIIEKKPEVIVRRRPRTSESFDRIDAIARSLLEEGWEQSDIEHAFREFLGDNREYKPRKAKMTALDFGDDDDKPVAPKPTEPAPAITKETPNVQVVKGEVVVPKCAFCGTPALANCTHATVEGGKTAIVHRACIILRTPPAQVEDGVTVEDPSTGFLMRFSRSDGKFVRISGVI